MSEPPAPKTNQPLTGSHDEEFFKEIEKRAYKGARKAIAHFVLMSTISFLIFWAILAFIFYTYAIPYAKNLMGEQIQQLNPVNQLQQEGIMDQIKDLYPN